MMLKNVPPMFIPHKEVFYSVTHTELPPKTATKQSLPSGTKSSEKDPPFISFNTAISVLNLRFTH